MRFSIWPKLDVVLSRQVPRPWKTLGNSFLMISADVRSWRVSILTARCKSVMAGSPPLHQDSTERC